MFLLSSGKLLSSRQAQFQIEDGLKSINVKYMRHLSSPTANISSLSDEYKNLQKQKRHFPTGPKVLLSIVSTRFCS